MPPDSCHTLEICVDSPTNLSAAASVADRIELCAGLEIGGLTPDYGLMEFAAQNGIETHVLIRGRGGDFTMEGPEIATASANVREVRKFGLKGIVIGAERNGQLDLRALEQLVRAADGLDLTLHRVIDVVDDPVAALSDAIELGFTRVLTSGGRPSALEGVQGLRRLHDAAGNTIEIMAGGGITSANLPELLARTGLTSFHASCSAKTPSHNLRPGFGFGRSQRRFDLPEAKKIAALLRGDAVNGRQA